jgi:sugar transferase (PEP-CTERM/EpsH1 system associated)
VKILLVCHRLPFPPKRGGKIRPFNIIRHLSESGHSVTVGSLARSEDELADGQGLTEYCDRLLVGTVTGASAMAHMILRLPTTSPSSMGNFYSSSLHREIRQELEQNSYDLIFVHCSSAAQYVALTQGIPSILDFGDMDSQKWLDYSMFKPFPLSVGYWLEGTKLCREEKRLARKFDCSTCTTQAELDTLNGFDVAEHTDWFPNGVDLEYFSPFEKDYDKNRICFVGRMDYYPNQQAMTEFCDDILPIIRSRRPQTELLIIGAEPSAEIRRLGQRPGVEVTGTVPDIRQHVQSSALSLAPLRIARGTQNKILESMAMGVPVVCSTKAAMGVDAIPGKHLLAEDSSEQIVEAIISLLDDPDRRRHISEAARHRVIERHQWGASMHRLDGIIAAVTK